MILFISSIPRWHVPTPLLPRGTSGGALCFLAQMFVSSETGTSFPPQYSESTTRVLSFLYFSWFPFLPRHSYTFLHITLLVHQFYLHPFPSFSFFWSKKGKQRAKLILCSWMKKNKDNPSYHPTPPRAQL